ncbi:hypothetical protein BH09ACT6_BH09ACT6_12700 [soil metagenome]
MDFDCVVLAGGLSARLGGRPKSALTIGGTSLLQLTLGATPDARQTIVVGDPVGIPGIRSVREDPPFSGPASAIAAGVDALRTAGREPSPFTLVLACDMPGVASAVARLRAAAGRIGRSDGVIAVDAADHPQFLVGLYRTSALVDAAVTHAGQLVDLSVRSLLDALTLVPVRIDDESTDDVDTWADAARFGVDQLAGPLDAARRTPDAARPPHPHATPHHTTPRK